MPRLVTESLFQIIAKQVDDKGLVVWYDPEQAYGSAAEEFALPNTTVSRYDGSFLKLRKEIDHLLNDGQLRVVLHRRTAMLERIREMIVAQLFSTDFACLIQTPSSTVPKRKTCNE